MNALGILLVWTAWQTTLFCLAAGGLYLCARRRRPAWGAAVLCGALLTTAGIAALAFSPWPRWPVSAVAGRIVRPADEVAKAGAPALSRASKPASDASAETAPGAGAAPLNAGVFRLFSGIWDRMQYEVQQQLKAASSADLDNRKHRWPAWLAAAMLGGVAVGAVRMFVGWLALVRLLRNTQRVTDGSLAILLEELRGKLGCRRGIELREMAGVQAGGSPAVVGWRRPVILLPADWRSWSAAARRGILAHEISHVVHGDFPQWLAAQAGVVIHFYNPLVHWLARRLRLEQELAADARGAALAGGPKAYATILAQMALQPNHARPLWAGRPFFPSRGTLMRRIEMLHHPRFSAERSPSRLGLTALLTSLALAAVGVAGFRGPSAAAQAADPPAKAEPAETAGASASDAMLPAFDRSYLPAETIGVLSLKSFSVAGSELVVEPAFCVLPNQIGWGVGPFKKDQARSFEVEELNAIALRAEPAPASSADSPAAANTAAVTIYRMRRPYEPSKLRETILYAGSDDVTEIVCHGLTCFRAGSDGAGDAIDYLMADDRTIVVVRDRDLARVLQADPESHPSWYDRWRQMADSPLAAALDSAALAGLEQEWEPKDAADRFFFSLAKETSLIFARADMTAGGVQFGVTFDCQSPEKAAHTQDVVRNTQAATLKTISQFVTLTPSSLPKEFQAIDVAGPLVQSLSALQLKVEGEQVRVEAAFGAAFVTQILAAQKAWQDALAENMKQEHLTKLGRLAAAFNAYHDAHGHYPPATVLGPDGKTPHSWRVELLPYLGEQRLFDSYKLDEPWDGEHNKRLIEKMPEVYGNLQSPKLGVAEYYVVTGEGTLFDGQAPTTRESISDAPGETILVMQSRRQIPWTRPVDLDSGAFEDSTQPAGGQMKDFYAAFADGTVRFVDGKHDPASVRALFTKAGGEQVKLR